MSRTGQFSTTSRGPLLAGRSAQAAATAAPPLVLERTRPTIANEPLATPAQLALPPQRGLALRLRPSKLLQPLLSLALLPRLVLPASPAATPSPGMCCVLATDDDGCSSTPGSCSCPLGCCSGRMCRRLWLWVALSSTVPESWAAR